MVLETLQYQTAIPQRLVGGATELLLSCCYFWTVCRLLLDTAHQAKTGTV